jgi:hypothetical protein
VWQRREALVAAKRVHEHLEWCMELYLEHNFIVVIVCDFDVDVLGDGKFRYCWLLLVEVIGRAFVSV